MAARHMAGQIPTNWLEDEEEPEARSYRGRHFKAAPVVDPVIPEPPTLQVEVKPDFDADAEARLIVEQIMRELDIAPVSRPEVVPAPVPEPATPVSIPVVVPEMDDLDVPEMDDLEPPVLREHGAVRVPEVAPAGEDILPIPHVAEVSVPAFLEDEALEDDVEIDELDSTLRLDRDALHHSLDEQEDELEATLALDRDVVREAVRGSSVPRERLSVQEALSASDQLEQESQREQYGAAARNLALDHELGDSTLRRIEMEEQRRPLSFFARIGAAVSRVLHLDRR